MIKQTTNVIETKKKEVIEELEKEFPGLFKISEPAYRTEAEISVLNSDKGLTLKGLQKVQMILSRYNDILTFARLQEQLFPSPKPVMREAETQKV